MPVDPCGYAVDFARACATYAVQPWSDSAARVNVRTYRVPNDTPMLPFPHAFLLSDWAQTKLDRELDDGDVGIGPRGAYSKGQPFPVGIIAPGHICGSDQAWRGEGKRDQDPPLEWTWAGPSTCCREPLNAGEGFPTTYTTDLIHGHAWTLTDPIFDTFPVHARYRASGVSKMLFVWGYGFNLPTGAIPVGFIARVLIGAINDPPCFLDRLVLSGGIDPLSENVVSAPVRLPLLEQGYLTFGSEGSNWGWAAPDQATVNDPAFGVGIGVSDGGGHAVLDGLDLTVFYYLPDVP
jgi:hypothetical protein